VSDHSVLPPSSSSRRVQCPQSATLELTYPEDTADPDAAAGIAAHWAAAEQLSGRLVDVGVIAPNGIVLDVEMCEAADTVSDYVTKLLQPHGLRPSDGHVEQRVDIPRIHPQSWGTPDYWIKVPGRFTLVLDLKYGHRYVPAIENMQLTEYLAGIVDDADPLPIIATIVQPRSYSSDGPVREWRTTALALRALINRASNAAHEAMSPTPRARVGDECRDCRARHACPVLQREGFAAMAEATHVSPLVMAPAAVSLELRMARRAQKLLNARVTGLEEQILATLKRGERVPGWSVTHGSGRERWSRPAAEVLAVGTMMGLDIAKPAEPITPTQARAKGLDPSVVDAMAERPKGAAALVEDDGAGLRSVFAKHGETPTIA
jgi:Protein of unknown function (DUF2800)